MGNTVEQEVAPDAPHDEMSTNYISTGESMNRAMTIVDINFAKKIASMIDPDLRPNNPADCKIWSDWKD